MIENKGCLKKIVVFGIILLIVGFTSLFNFNAYEQEHTGTIDNQITEKTNVKLNANSHALSIHIPRPFIHINGNDDFKNIFKFF